jgi:predicted enzyme related to lactoylglutathione lyase
VLVLVPLKGQTDPFQQISFAFGEWEGTGEGFGSNRSTIESRFEPVMNGNYIEVTNESWFESTEENPQGDHHIDNGFISYDKDRGTLVYRQFNNEGYINQYVLNDTLSSDSELVFETESIENFVPNGKARITIRRIADDTMETVFDVSFPNSGYTCFSTNQLKRKATAHPHEHEPGITGIGGIFFHSERPEELRRWYHSHLNLVTDEYGAVFEFRNASDPGMINYLRWSAFEKTSEYFTPSEKPFMINYRVRHLEEVVKELTTNGITVLDQIAEYEYGKFVHLMDPEGNKVELWEPNDQFFTQMGGPTNK